MRAISAILIVACAGALSAQQQPPPVFRGGTDLVEVDVIVRDKTGAFVSDLSPDDFTVEEGGARQDIQQFYVRLTNATSLPPGAAPRAIGPPADAPSRRVFVVIFDDQHLSPAGFKRTQAAAEMLFSKYFRAGDVGGVVVRGRMANDRLTSDREELIAAVRKAKPNLASNSRLFDSRQWPRLSEIEAIRIVVNADTALLTDVVQRACTEDVSACRFALMAVQGKAQKIVAESRAESSRTLQTIAATLSGLARLDGRKTILLMSEGFLSEESWPIVQEAVSRAARANARMYALDGRGLDRPLRNIDDVEPLGTVDITGSLLEKMEFGADAMNSLAVDTGGFVAKNLNAFDTAIDRIGDDAGNYYVLGYRPTTAQDGRFHSIKVSVKRDAVSVRARRGYVATIGETATPSPAANASSPVTALPAAERVPEPATPPAAEATAASATASHDEGTVVTHLRPKGAENAKRLTPLSATDPDATNGWSAYQRGDVKSARESLAIAAARPSAHAWVHYTLGLSSYALGRYQESVDAWERVRSAAAEFEPVYFDLIDAYLQLRDYDRAIRTARAAIERWPKDAEIYQALGVVQTVRGSLDDAIKSFEQAISLTPDEPNVYFNLAKAMELRYVRSRRYVQQLRSWVSNDRDRQAAIENYKRHLEMNGSFAESARAGLQRLQFVPSAKN
jgi:VWFA-related protein